MCSSDLVYFGCSTERRFGSGSRKCSIAGYPLVCSDWTENPLDALFFAVEKDHEGDSAVWCIRPFASFSLEEGPFGLKDVIVVYLPHVSQRITVQKGMFTAHPIPDTPISAWPFWIQKVIADMTFRVIIRNELRIKSDAGKNMAERGGFEPPVEGLAPTTV